MNRSKNNRRHAFAWFLRMRACAAGILGGCLLSACAMDARLGDLPGPAGIEVTLTTIDAFGAVGTSTVMPHGGGGQLGYVSAVAASGASSHGASIRRPASAAERAAWPAYGSVLDKVGPCC